MSPLPIDHVTAWYGPLRTLDDIERLERTPWRERLDADTTYGLLRDACETYPDRLALRLLLSPSPESPVRELRYRQLLEGVHRTANALVASGLSEGAAVTILLPNLLESHFALWGAQAAAIASPVNPMLDAAYIARICVETKAQVLVALGPAPGSDIWDKAVQIAEQVRSIHTILQVNLGAALGKPGATKPEGAVPARTGVRIRDFHQALAEARSDGLAFDRRVDPEAPCAYFHTGGTTGFPKVAVHRHLNEAFMACSLRWLDDREDVVLAGLPLFHVNGAIVTGLGAFHRGAQVVMLTPAGYRTPGLLDQFWAIARRFGATTFRPYPPCCPACWTSPGPRVAFPPFDTCCAARRRCRARSRWTSSA